MRAFSLKNGELAVREVPTPTPGSGQILVRTLACAICASDHHYMDHMDVARADKTGMRVDAPDRDVVMGHEYCAEIVEYGSDTERRWPVGTRVTGVPVLMSVDGPTRILGMAPDAPGGFGEFFVMNECFAKAVPDDVAPEIVAVNDAVAVGWYYSREGTSGKWKDAAPLVVGLGAIGMSVVIGLKHRGASPIVAADFSESRRNLALQYGADIVVDPAVQSPFAAWRQAVWGAPEEMHDYMLAASLRKQVVYECVGVDGVLGDIVDKCEFGSRVISAGSAPQDTIPSTVAHMKGVNIQFGGGPQLSDWYECLDLVVSGEIDVKPLIGETVSLEDLPDAFERARSGAAPIRIVYTADGATASRPTPNATPPKSGPFTRQSTVLELSRTRTGRALRRMIERQARATATSEDEARVFAGAAGYMTIAQLVVLSGGKLPWSVADSILDLANGESTRILKRMTAGARKVLGNARQ
jgi:threonine dehydrogenase-like Zn-dependent dehydrogenase